MGGIYDLVIIGAGNVFPFALTNVSDFFEYNPKGIVDRTVIIQDGMASARQKRTLSYTPRRKS